MGLQRRLERRRRRVAWCAAIGAVLALAPAPAWADESSSFLARVRASPAGQNAANVGIRNVHLAYKIFGAPDRIQAHTVSNTGDAGAAQKISSATLDADHPDIAVDPDGDALIVYEQECGTPASTCIMARERFADGTLASPQKLTGPGCVEPDVAAGPDGEFAVIYTCDASGNSWVRTRVRNSSGTLGPTRTLSAGDVDAANPQIAGDDFGNFHAVWQGSDGTTERIQLRTVRANGGLRPMQNVSPATGSASFPRIETIGNGRSVLVWQRFDNVATTFVETRTRFSSGGLGGIVVLNAPGSDGFEPEVGLDGEGNAQFVWHGSPQGLYRIHAVHRTASGVLGPIRHVSNAVGHHFGPRIARNAAGHSVVTWTQEPGGGFHRIFVRSLLPSGGLGQLEILSTAPFGPVFPSPDISIDDDGSALAVFGRWSGTHSQIWTSARP